MIRLAVRVQRAEAELVLAELLDLAPGGLEEVELDGDIVEFAVYGPPGELPELPDLRAAAGSALVDVSSSEVADDWSERWRQFHKPVLLASPAPGRVPALRVRAPWEPALEHGSGVCEVVIDPGRAFGTGAHATTRLCLELLLRLRAEDPPSGLLDVGAGSGVIAIAAARLGYAPVTALDNDLDSLAATQANAAVNVVQLGVRQFDLRRDALPVAGEVVVANLLRPLLLELAARLQAPPADLIAGGLLRAEADQVAGAFAAGAGMRELARVQAGDWAALWLRSAG